VIHPQIIHAHRRIQAFIVALLIFSLNIITVDSIFHAR